MQLKIAVNLEVIRSQLLIPSQQGKGWSIKKTEQAISNYKKFLLLHYLYPTLTLVSTQEVDIVWHCHILNPEKYAEDCHSLFGHMLHHFPLENTEVSIDKENAERVLPANSEKDIIPKGNIGSCVSEKPEKVSKNSQQDYIHDRGMRIITLTSGATSLGSILGQLPGGILGTIVGIAFAWFYTGRSKHSYNG